MKLLLSAALCAAMFCVSPFAVSQEVTVDAVPVAADCNCAPVTCCDTKCCKPKKFHKVEYQKEVCRIRRVTVIDECGCEKKKCMKVSECVTRTRIERVDPCAPTCLDKLKDRLGCGKCKARNCCPTTCDCCGGGAATIVEPAVLEIQPVIEQPQAVEGAAEGT
jgi:hypothetical protein